MVCICRICMLINLYKLDNEWGNLLYIWSWVKRVSWSLCKSSILNIFSDLIKGQCGLYILSFWLIELLFYLKFKYLVHEMTFPNACIPCVKWICMRAKYSVLRASCGKYVLFCLWMALVNLDFNLFTWVFQVMCSSIYKPRNLIEFSREIDRGRTDIVIAHICFY